MGYLKVKRNICPFSKYRKTLHEHPKYILCSFSWCKRIRQNGTSGFLRSATYNFITFLLQEFLPFKNTVYSVRKLGLATANKQSLYNFLDTVYVCLCMKWGLGCGWGLDAPAHPSATILLPRVALPCHFKWTYLGQFLEIWNEIFFGTSKDVIFTK